MSSFTLNFAENCFSGALAFAELGTIIPRSGAEYSYYMDSFGPLHKFWGRLPSFIYSWVLIFITKPAEVAIIILTFSEYLCQPIFDVMCIYNSEDSERVKKAVALLALGKKFHLQKLFLKTFWLKD